MKPHKIARKHELTDLEWRSVQPFFPKQRGRAGMFKIDNRTSLNGILWVGKTGMVWRDLPQRYGDWNTLYHRYRKWLRTGILERVFAQLNYPPEAMSIAIKQPKGAVEASAGTPSPKPPRTRKGKVDRVALEQAVADNPKITQKELAQMFGCSRQWIGVLMANKNDTGGGGKINP